MDANQENPTFAYDRIAYPGSADAHINLLNLEVVAAMFGFPLPDPRQSRILEIGCANGTNLMPMASEFPDSEFVGVDRVADRITEAKSTAEQAGLRNIAFHAQSLSHLDESLEQFDFILAPGVYSWVTDQERDDLLRLCNRHLTTNGIAVISYNTFPGWKWLGAIRDFVRLHVDHSLPWRDQVKQARAIVDHIAEHSPKSPQKRFYTRKQGTFRGSHDSYLYHDYLAELNQPFYFHEFEAEINNHQLKFVAEADFRCSSGFGLEPSAREAILEAPPDRQQSLLDMLLNTSYRKSILCRAECVYSRPDATTLMDQNWMSLDEKVDPSSVHCDTHDPINLDYANGNVSTNDAMTKHAIAKMAECWPQAIRLQDLSVAEEDVATTSQKLLALYGASFIRLFKQVPHVAPEISEKPAAMPITRAMAARGGQVVSQWHDQVNGLSELDRTLLKRLDGTVTQNTLSAEFATLGVTTEQVQQTLKRLFEFRLLVS